MFQAPKGRDMTRIEAKQPLWFSKGALIRIKKAERYQDEEACQVCDLTLQTLSLILWYLWINAECFEYLLYSHLKHGFVVSVFHISVF